MLKRTLKVIPFEKKIQTSNFYFIWTPIFNFQFLCVIMIVPALK
ncbi:hypothetical protein ATHSA_1665 [Athalassotoga saccharophila]|nr:hypothetical protein ATHSA_1665 [Athalassotoga saccharophila]